MVDKSRQANLDALLRGTPISSKYLAKPTAAYRGIGPYSQKGVYSSKQNPAAKLYAKQGEKPGDGSDPSKKAATPWMPLDSILKDLKESPFSKEYAVVIMAPIYGPEMYLGNTTVYWHALLQNDPASRWAASAKAQVNYLEANGNEKDPRKDKNKPDITSRFMPSLNVNYQKKGPFAEDMGAKSASDRKYSLPGADLSGKNPNFLKLVDPVSSGQPGMVYLAQPK